MADFDNLFKFNKGGIVPGVGNTDKVLALLTPGELVIPKDVVQGMFKSSAPVMANPVFAAQRGVRPSDTKDTGSTVYQFNTTVNNPVTEEASVSVQKRVRSVAALGLLGR